MQNILDSLKAAVAMLRSEDEPPDSANLSVLCQVNTASQKAIQKMERKANKRTNARQGNKVTNDLEFDFIRTAGWAALQACSLGSRHPPTQPSRLQRRRQPVPYCSVFRSAAPLCCRRTCTPTPARV